MSTIKIIEKLQSSEAIIKKQLAEIEDQHIQDKSQGLLEFFADQLEKYKVSAESLEQSKGILKAFSMAPTLVQQNTDAAKAEYGEDADKADELKAVIKGIDMCVKTLRQIRDNQELELRKFAGTLEGKAQIAMDALARIESYIKHHKDQLSKAEEDEVFGSKGDTIDSMMDEKAELEAKPKKKTGPKRQRKTKKNEV